MNPIRKALKNPSYPHAVVGHCYWCMGGDVTDPHTSQSVTRRVRECHLCDCPLWLVRPWRTKDQQKADSGLAGECRARRPRLDLIEIARRTRETAYANPASKKRALLALCWQCLQQAPKNCGITGCPVYPVRGGKKIDSDDLNDV